MKQLTVLVVSTLYPNAIQFRHGIFVETRIKHVQESGGVKLSVIAPVPWFPCKIKRLPQYSQLVDVPRHEIRHDIEIFHPRYLVIPKIGMLLTPFFLAFAIYRQIKQLPQELQDFQVIDAHYYYPDGVAAAIIARIFNKPLTITARGSDINLIADDILPRRMMDWAGRVARYNLAVCRALADRMVEIGMPETSMRVVRNGVDLDLFKPLPQRDALRQKWQVRAPLLISVGYLIERKGHHLIIDAMQSLAEYELFIVGDGEWAQRLQSQVVAAGLQSRVRFIGEVRQEQLCELYNCADALVLASSREGWANVLLESMACGTPVVATNIWGTPEVVQSQAAGVLCEARTAESIASSVRRLFAAYPRREQTREYAETFSWADTTQKLLSIWRSC
jgi:teichuronic acid biosynthesis glycosyltransferase TuaC